MKKTLSVFATLALLFFGAACVPQETNTSETGDKEGNTETSNAPSVTVGADNISAVSVVLKGKANLKSSVSSDLSMGIMWSKNAGVLPSNSTKTEATNIDGDYNYSVGVTGLEPETTYYYRSYVTQNGQDTYGETLYFSTKDVSSLLETLDATNVAATTATLNAKLDLTDVRYTSISYGFLWGESEQELSRQSGGGEIINNEFTASITDRSHKTQYWYKAYVRIDSQSFYGEVSSFTTDAVRVESVSLDMTKITTYNTGRTYKLRATVLPVDADEKGVEWTSSNPEVATVSGAGLVTAISNGTTSIMVTTKDQNKTASCTIIVDECYTAVAGEAIDLGLSVKWSNVNLGATKPDDYGGYFAWGETEPYYQFSYSWGTEWEWRYGKTAGYDESSYKWYNGTYEKCTKYCPSNCVAFWDGSGTPDNKTNFSDYDYEDDAARVVLGGGWRVPTIAEWKELMDNCTWTWREQTYNRYGEVLQRSGMTIRSNMPGYTDKSIFLPAAGWFSGKDLSYRTERGEYWSSDLATNYQLNGRYVPSPAQCLHFRYSKNISRYVISSDVRHIGKSIRPVKE